MITLDFKKTASRWRLYSRNYYSKGMNLYNEVNKTSIAISTLTIGFNGVLLQANEGGTLSTVNKFFTTASFLFSLFSIIMGLVVFFMSNMLFNSAGKHYEQISNNLYNWITKNNTDNGNEYPPEIYLGVKELKRESDNTPSYLQIATTVIGLLCTIPNLLNLVFC